jgi:hypothetical protein
VHHRWIAQRICWRRSRRRISTTRFISRVVCKDSHGLDFPDETSLRLLGGRNKSASWNSLVPDSLNNQFKEAFSLIKDGVKPIMWFDIPGASSIRETGIISLLEKSVLQNVKSLLIGKGPKRQCSRDGKWARMIHAHRNEHGLKTSKWTGRD